METDDTLSYLQTMALLALASDTHRVNLDDLEQPFIEKRPEGEAPPRRIPLKPDQILWSTGRPLAWEHETPITINNAPVFLVCSLDKENPLGFDVKVRFTDESGKITFVSLEKREKGGDSP